MMVLLVVAAAYAGFRLYSRHEDKTLLDQIVDQNGYTWSEKDKPVTFTLNIKAEWLPEAGDSKKDLNVPAGYDHHTLFVLQRTEKRGTSTYFSFKAIPELNKAGGEFLHTEELGAGGTSVPYSPAGAWKLNKSGSTAAATVSVPYGLETGEDETFSFVLADSDLARLGSDGFTASYSGLILYTYSKT